MTRNAINWYTTDRFVVTPDRRLGEVDMDGKLWM
jgi:hypothetical protein